MGLSGEKKGRTVRDAQILQTEEEKFSSLLPR